MPRIFDIDPAVAALKSSLRRPAVLKMRLAYVRSELPNTVVFAFEGDDDKIVYSHWIARIRADLGYEPFPCGGKENVFELMSIVERDLTNLKRGVYFFIDRDFDDLAGHSHSANLFMTDRYSVENYLVTAQVIESVLINEFHCTESPKERAAILKIFDEAYTEFLSITSILNKRLFAGKKIGLTLKKDLPGNINNLVEMNLINILELKTSPEIMVQFTTALEAENQVKYDEEFELLSPPERFRGKFAYMFMKKWLDLLAEEYRNPTSNVFANIARKSSVRQGELVLGNFASKCALPSELPLFLSSIEKLLPQTI